MKNSHQEIIDATRKFVRNKMEGEGSGHDWWHVLRVVNSSLEIAKTEGGDLFVIELAALLHDIADWKFHDGDITVGPRITREWLDGLNVEPEVIEQVAYIVENISFRGGTNKHKMKSIDGEIVQDADRLDAIGAIGIARTFTFGGSRGREIHNPKIKPNKYDSLKKFKDSIDKNTTINHFYEKLLLVKSRMNTDTGKRLAENRHKFMEKFLVQFYAEWDGKK